MEKAFPAAMPGHDRDPSAKLAAVQALHTQGAAMHELKLGYAGDLDGEQALAVGSALLDSML